MSLESHVHLYRAGRSGDPRTLLMLHGTGDDEQGFARLADALAPAAAVLAVRGNVQEGGMNRFFRRQAEGVYDMADLAERTIALAGFVDAAVAAYNIARTSLIGVGYSNGANILANLLFEAPQTVAAVSLMHPLIPFEPPVQVGLGGKRILITAGERDPICPPGLSRSLQAYFERQKAESRLVFFPGGHEVTTDEVAAVRNFLQEFTPALT